ncbi:MAG: nucleotidyltransferase domain-containing protein [Patescibacteria group bacterium]
MKLEHASIEDVKKNILKVVGKYLDLQEYRVFIFGSRVTGGSRETSDIDIGIEGPKPVSIDILARIKGEIQDLPMLYTVDVVDFNTVSDDFRQIALRAREFLT